MNTLNKNMIRPAIGWVSFVAITLFFIIQPIAVLIMAAVGIPYVPVILSDGALITLLGITAANSASRSYDKAKGTHND